MRLLLNQWPRKLVSFLIAIAIWIFVNHTITANKIIPFVPIRVINLPPDKIISGLLPNGFLSKRTTLTLSGTKNIIDQLEPGDVEVVIDVGNQNHDFVAQITKNNLVSLNPNINLPQHITLVSHPELVLKMSPRLTEKIPIIILPPLGQPPTSYEFIDIWPYNLYQTVSGPQDQVRALKKEGIKLQFNLSDISKEQLDALQSEGQYRDEVSFYVPDQWKKITIPLSTRGIEMINDPDAKALQINFLRQRLIFISDEIPLHIFYPLKSSAELNPHTRPLEMTPFVSLKNDIPILKIPLFIQHVSQFFVEIIKENLEINIIADSSPEVDKLMWNTVIVDQPYLSDKYISSMLSHSKHLYDANRYLEKQKLYQQRFLKYANQLKLYLSLQQQLELDIYVTQKNISAYVPHPTMHFIPYPMPVLTPQEALYVK